MNDEITNFKSGAKYFESFRFKPQFYLIIYRNIENQFENTFLVIYNEKDLVYDFLYSLNLLFPGLKARTIMIQCKAQSLHSIKRTKLINIGQNFQDISN